MIKFTMIIRIYVRASTKEQDAKRALAGLIEFSQDYGAEHVAYIENESGTVILPYLMAGFSRIKTHQWWLAAIGLMGSFMIVKP